MIFNLITFNVIPCSKVHLLPPKSSVNNSELTLTYGISMDGSHCLAIWVMMLLQVLLSCAIFLHLQECSSFWLCSWLGWSHFIFRLVFTMVLVHVCEFVGIGVCWEIWGCSLAILYRWAENSFFSSFMSSMMVWLSPRVWRIQDDFQNQHDMNFPYNAYFSYP